MADQKSAVGLQKELDLAKAIEKVYDPAQAKNYSFFIRRFDKARDQRNQKNKYFDDLGYVQDYIQNENAKNTYLRPKLNDSEVRVNTGTTEKKIETVANELLAMNLQHEIRAYDMDDLEVSELGADMGDIVTRTNQQEKDEDFWQEATIELLTQRAVFIEERFVRRAIKNRTQYVTRAEKRLVSGLKMFLGDITIPAYRHDEQPYQIKYDRVHRDVAESLWGHLPEWKHVKGSAMNRQEYLGGAFAYRFAECQQDEVEVIHYESVPDGEEQLFLNGVMMYPDGKKLESAYPGYSIKMFVLKSNSPDFAYGRPLTASAKTLQALSNENIRLMIRKFQQAIEPPLGVPKGKVYSRGMWDPGAVTQGIRKGEFEQLISHDGVTPGEISMYKLIEQKIEEFVGAGSLQQGISTDEKMTATQVLELQKQALKNLGLAVLGISRMKRDLAEMRIYTFIENYLTPVRRKFDPAANKLQDIFRSFTLENAQLGNERRGKKIIQLSNRDLTPEEQVQLHSYEEQQAEIGNHFRYKNLNVNTLKELVVQWHVTVSPQEREGSALDKVIFQDQLNQGLVISKVSGRPLNGDTIVQSFERKWKAKDWFQKQAPQALMDGARGGMGPDGAPADIDEKMKEIDQMLDPNSVGAQVSRGLRGSTPRPSVSSLNNAA